MWAYSPNMEILNSTFLTFLNGGEPLQKLLNPKTHPSCHQSLKNKIKRKDVN
jgi:hypothetical protein